MWGVTGDPHRARIVAGWGGRVTAVAVLGWPLLHGAVHRLRAAASSTSRWRRASRCSCGPARPAPWRRPGCAARLPGLVARDLARRTLTVPDDLPLAEAVRRAQEAEAGGIVTVTSGGVAGRRGQRGGAAGHARGPAPVGGGLDRGPDARGRDCGCRPPSPARSWSWRSAGRPAQEYLLIEDDGSIYGVLVDRRRRRGVPRATAPLTSGGACPQGPLRMLDDVTPEAWSGVHRGPLRAGEWVRLTDSKGRRHNICLEPGKRFFSNRGHFDHDELIGREEGFTVTSSAGGEYLVFRPLLSEFVVSMPRGAAVVYPKDAAQIVAMADIFPGAHVVEAGRRLRGPDLLAAARGRSARARVVVRAPRGVRRRRPAQRRPVLRRPRRREPPGVAADPRRPRRGAARVRRAGRPDHPRHARALGLPRRRGRRAAARRHRLRVRRHHDPAVPVRRDGARARRLHRARAPGSPWCATGTSRAWRCGPGTR